MRQLIILLSLIVFSLGSRAQSPEWVVAGMPKYGWQVRCIYNDTSAHALYVTGGILNSRTDYSEYYICKYDGTNWSTIGSFDSQILSLVNYNGDLVAAGFFNAINGVPIFSIARYDGSNWNAMGNFDLQVSNLKVIGSDLYAMGYFDVVDGITAKRIAKWNGTSWSDVYNFSADTMAGHITDVEIYKGNTYVCGNFANSELGIHHLAVFKSGSWQNVGGGILGSWTDLVEFATYKNELYLAGSILKPSGNVGHMIQKWNDTAWSEVGGSVQDINGGYGFCGIRDMLVHNDELYIAGGFGYAGNIPATFVAKWNGLKWCALATHELFTTGSGAQVGNALDFYNDTLYLGIGNDTLNGVLTNRIIKYIAGDYTDTCSISFTGIEESPFGNNIQLFPNPTQSTLTLQFSEAIKETTNIEIKNILGQTIKILQLPTGIQQQEIDVSDFSNGLYFVQYQNKSMLISKKFVKQ